MQKRKIIKKFHKNCHLKTSSGHFCLERIKHNLYWKAKSLKQPPYIRYVLARLSQFVQISTLTISDSFFTEDSLKIKKALEEKFLNFFYNIIKAGQISLSDCVDFSCYLIKCVLCSTLRHLMTSWHLNTWKVKIWLSQERKGLSKWNEKHFSLFQKCYLSDIQFKLAKI